MFTKDFKNLTKSDVAIAGGKGASLGEMTRVDIPVPSGFVVLSSAFERFIEETDLNVEIDAKLHKVDHNVIHTVEEASEKIQALILNTKMSEDIVDEIQKEFKKLDAKYVAVRSSATAEDSSTAAWAGQLDSFLNTTEESLLENVRKCWASLFTPRAIFYRFEQNLHKQKISVAVVIQKMVESEKSGIAFSVHPVTQDRNQLIIEAGYGLGEAIVSGSITPDGYVVEKEPRRIIDKNINTQERELVRAKTGGNEWQDISKEKGEKSVLDDEQIMELTELILKIENHYKFPQDIEWAFENSEFYITQSRPITTLNTTVEDYNESKVSKVISLFADRQVEKEVDYGFIPVVYFESSLNSYYNNPHFKNIPLGIVMLNKRFEYWWIEDENEPITDKKKINKIVLEINKIPEKHEGYLGGITDDYVRNKQNLATVLEKLNYILEETYRLFLLFTGEYFETGSTKVQALLRETRMDISEGLITKNWTAYDVLLKEISHRFNISYERLSRALSSELKELLNTGVLSSNVTQDRKLAFVVSGDRVHIFYNEEEIDTIQKYLTTHNISKENIKRASEELEIKGFSCHEGVFRGEVLIMNWQEPDFDLGIFGKRDNLLGKVLVTTMTRPEHTPYIKKIGAIITDEGGITCHAAIIAREMKKPCIIGTKIATQVLKDGDLVEVDADNGVVRILKK